MIKKTICVMFGRIPGCFLNDLFDNVMDHLKLGIIDYFIIFLS